MGIVSYELTAWSLGTGARLARRGEYGTLFVALWITLVVFALETAAVPFRTLGWLAARVLYGR